jgi:alpha-beta hydrolase superfamily lysophospholipase
MATAEGAALWLRHWAPEDHTRAAVVLVHGLGEHSGRYEHVALRLTDAGFALAAFDLRGHGRSSGRRGDTRIEKAKDDAELVMAAARARHPGLPLFLYGHSLGALVVLALLVSREPSVDGAIVSAPPLLNALRKQRLKVLLARALGGLLPWLAMPSGIDVRAISRDPAVLAAYLDDPLVHDRATLGLARDALVATAMVEAATTAPCPLLLLHGGADRIAFPEGSRDLARRLGGDVTLREYGLLFHEPHNEPEKDAVLGDVLAWVNDRIRA